jgi:hypothetical protein
MSSISIKAPVDRVRNFILSPETVLRLNPSWHVRGIEADGENIYSLSLFDDSADATMQISLQVEVHEEAICYIMDSEMIMFIVDELEPSLSRLTITGDMFRNEDLPYWLKGVRNYMLLRERQSRVITWFLDCVWLRMTPSQRRIAVIVIMAEGVGFIALLAVIVALKFLRS